MGSMFFSLGLSLETTGNMLFGMTIFTETILNHMYVISINEYNYETELLGEEVIILQNNPDWTDPQKQYLKLYGNSRILDNFWSELYSSVVEETNLKAVQMMSDGNNYLNIGKSLIVFGTTAVLFQIGVYFNSRMNKSTKDIQQK